MSDEESEQTRDSWKVMGPKASMVLSNRCSRIMGLKEKLG